MAARLQQLPGALQIHRKDPAKQSSRVELALLHPRWFTLGKLLYLFELRQFREMGQNCLQPQLHRNVVESK